MQLLMADPENPLPGFQACKRLRIKTLNAFWTELLLHTRATPKDAVSNWRVGRDVETSYTSSAVYWAKCYRLIYRQKVQSVKY